MFLNTTEDGLWDYIYNGSLDCYEGLFQWLYLIIGIIITVFSIIFLLFETGVLYLYKKEHIVEE